MCGSNLYGSDVICLLASYKFYQLLIFVKGFRVLDTFYSLAITLASLINKQDLIMGRLIQFKVIEKFHNHLSFHSCQNRKRQSFVVMLGFCIFELSILLKKHKRLEKNYPQSSQDNFFSCFVRFWKKSSNFFFRFTDLQQ